MNILRIFDKEVKICSLDEVLAIGRENHGHYRVMPRIGVIEGKMSANGWDFLPMEDDDCVIPKEAWKHVELLKKHNIPIKQIIIGHNVKEEEEKQKRMEALKKGAEQVIGFVSILAIGALTAIAGTGIAVVLGAIGLLLAIDPILVVVLEDDTWLCVAEWEV